MSTSFDIVVVGGGPAGATAAGYLAMHGHSVLLLERSEFPRHRIGESLLPSLMPILEDFDLVNKCHEAGFVKKTGATFIWGKSREPWEVNFETTPFLPAPYTFHVDRAAFDQILLDHARERGVEVRQNVRVTDVLKDGERVVGVTYREGRDGPVHSVNAQFVVDASGSASVIGRRVTERHFDDKMRQIALYGYWKNIRGAEGHQRNHIFIESCPKGWFWYIPMNSKNLGEVSLGLVTGEEFKEEMKRKGKQAFYEEALAGAPQIRKLLGPDAERIGDMRGVRDWAYTCDRAAGPGFYLAGDAAAFLDPLLSTGVSLAMLAGYSASVCIHTSLENPQMEEPATSFYCDNYRQMYEVTRDFLHYFYAGNATAHKDEIFWEARRTLKFGDNIGAKQAFGFLINTIPANPHPAVQKQIPMFHQFVNNIDLMTQLEQDEKLHELIEEGESLRHATVLEDDTIPVANGKLESTWTIDRDNHELKPIRGITYDRERPVFSSTGSWLMGRNVAALDDEACDLLELMDGSTPWRAIVEKFAQAAGLTIDTAQKTAGTVIDRLLAEQFVLIHEPLAQ
jgi:flavin-dependent dehydrogenase